MDKQMITRAIPKSSWARADFVRQGWLRDGESPLLRQLAYGKEMRLTHLTDEGLHLRSRVLSEMADGTAQPRTVSDCLTEPGSFDTQADVLVAEVERFGLPLRTVLSLSTGSMRSDPYYDDEYLAHFYREHYRALYRKWGKSHGRFFREQIQRGEAILSAYSAHLPTTGRVLDVGCGMGGSLVPFAMAGWQTLGCDYGEDYIELGRRAGLNLRTGGHEDIAEDGPFELLILSHVLEHIVEPVSFLTSLRELLTEDGHLLVAVPGLLSVERDFGGDLLNYLQNAHVWHFTSTTLEALLGRAGFAVLESNEDIRCLARPGNVQVVASADHGARVRRVIEEIEHRFQATRRVKQTVRWGKNLWRAVRGRQ